MGSETAPSWRQAVAWAYSTAFLDPLSGGRRRAVSGPFKASSGRLLLTSPSTEPAVSGAMNLGFAGRPHVVEVFIEAPGASGSIADKQQPRHWRALRITQDKPFEAQDKPFEAQDKPETDLLSSSRGSRIRRSLELMFGG